MQRLDGLPDDEQHAILLDLVRSNIATVAWATPARKRSTGPGRSRSLGFDSLTAVEMRNKLQIRDRSGAFAHAHFRLPQLRALAGYMHRELLGASPPDAPVAHPVRPNCNAWWRPFRSSDFAGAECWTCCWPLAQEPRERSRRQRRQRPPKKHCRHGPRRPGHVAFMDDDE
ncbi:putative polyketide synthase [Mycobacterium kansasii 662]|uniref:Putative polyketide synthase n=1 Tax=Mycobacterium kansasii 662 TaxID=1299326 RepID=X7YHN4_MYCKA|nr:putative polyketide synthase [Mycobacterium kansasii 662]